MATTHEAEATGAAGYTYSPPTGSILYQNVLSPYFYANVVELYPRWLHPNTITCMGFSSTFSMMMLVLNHSPSLKSEAPPWVYGVCSILSFLYMVFDNTDGKQARRIGASSYVGEALDHGVDMACTTLNSVVLMDAAGMGRSIDVSVLLIFGITLAMYANNWFHSVTGKMSFGGRYISVDEAMLATVLILAVRWYSADASITDTTPNGRNIFDATVYELSTDTVPSVLQQLGKDFQPADQKEGVFAITGALAFALLSFVPAINDSVTKYWYGLEYASVNGKTESAVASLLPYVQYLVLLGLLFSDRCRAAFGTTGLACSLVISGAFFAQIGCAIVMNDSLPSSAKAFHRVGTHVLTFLAIWAYVVNVNTDAEVGLQYLAVGAGAIELICFMFAINSINDAKGGGSMFSIKPKGN
jgi:phosphatidylglycerophosphate synthase